MKSQKAFLMFLKNDGYTATITARGIDFKKPCAPDLRQDHRHGPNEAMRHRQLLFFKIWFRKDKSFIDDLAAEFERQLKGAELVKLGVAA